MAPSVTEDDNAALKRQIEQLQKELVRLKKKVKTEKQNVAREKRKKEEIEREVARGKQKTSGVFYLTIDQVFRANNEESFSPRFTAANYRKCCRKTLSAMSSRRVTSNNGGFNVSTIDYYAKTKEGSTRKNVEPCNQEDKSRNSIVTACKDRLWPCHIMANGTIKGVAPIAHLVPAAPAHADSYWFVTDFLYGVSRERNWKTVQLLIHGAYQKQTKKENGKRIDDTGIKHMVSNKIRLSGRKYYFDNKPCILIIPCVDQDFAKKWTGEGYDAIVLIDGYKNDAMDETQDERIENVASSTLFSTQYPDYIDQTATFEEVEKAASLLTNYTRAINFAQAKRMPRELKKEETFSIDTSQCNTHEHIPTLKFTGNSFKSGGKVRKISFADNKTAIDHPAPDPLLLISKCAGVIARRYGFNLTADAEPNDDVHSDWGTLDEIAAEEYLANRRQMQQIDTHPIGMSIVIS